MRHMTVSTDFFFIEPSIQLLLRISSRMSIRRPWKYFEVSWTVSWRVLFMGSPYCLHNFDRSSEISGPDWEIRRSHLGTFLYRRKTKRYRHKDTLEAVLSYMNTFKERDRLILTMRIWEEMSYEEISQITGRSVSNAKKSSPDLYEKISANVQYFSIISFLVSYVFVR